jgi:outer membrane receptor protein involved in Fe transport
VGFNITPQALPSFTASVDYYNIKIENVVGVIAANVALNTCLDTGDPTYCALIVRGHTTGGLVGNNIADGGYIVQKNLNVAQAKIDGIDLQAAYRLNFGESAGSLSFAMNGAYLLSTETTPLPGAHTYDCAGPVRQHLPDGEPALAPQPAHHVGDAVELRRRPHLAIRWSRVARQQRFRPNPSGCGAS